jgi:hypothetical protein
MKRFTVFFCTCVALMAGLSNCKKKNEGGSSANFFPLSTGSTWTYKENVANVTYVYTSTGRDTTISGRGYKVISNSIGPNVYSTQVGSDYFRYGALNTGLSSAGIEELFLKDNLAVNGTWSTQQNVTYNGTNYVLNLNYRILEIAATKTFNGRTYNNVIGVNLDIATTVSGFSVVLGNGKFYYANGIGMVRNELAINPPAGAGLPNISQNTDLLTYTIR